ncbi:MAG: NAD-binding protein [Candidatus Aureabacteria bacterium]|nr:NAD-binding protein [Candidatus Auribacterota bacterium]
MNVIIVGCGRVGSELALLLSREGNNVAVVDNNKTSFHRLGGTFNGLCVTGNGFDLEVLRRAGVESADAFVVVTNGDNTNIMASQVAKKIFNVPKVIARVYDPRRADIYKRFGLEIISGTTLLASMIRDKLIESRFSGFFIETRGMGIIEINVTEDFVGKTVSELNRPDEFLIATIIKKNNPVIPSPMTRLELGDVLIGIVRTESVKKIKSMFKMED